MPAVVVAGVAMVIYFGNQLEGKRERALEIRRDIVHSEIERIRLETRRLSGKVKEVTAQYAGVETSRPDARKLPLPKTDGVWHFAIFGDRTGGPPDGIEILRQGVADVNLFDPDLTMTVGDLIQGYNRTSRWLEEMREYTGVMNELRRPWFPVAGNHDIYWRGGQRPDGHHEANYEEHFGPLWYSFDHK